MTNKFYTLSQMSDTKHENIVHVRPVFGTGTNTTTLNNFDKLTDEDKNLPDGGVKTGIYVTLADVYACENGRMCRK
jgi:hypothetical protein